MLNARTKGSVGEREMCKLLNAALIDEFPLGIAERNLEQTRIGGCDIVSMPLVAVEIKRVEKLQIPTWWRKLLKDAEKIDKIPILIYRLNRQPWWVVIPKDFNDPSMWVQTLTFEEFIALYKDLMCKDNTLSKSQIYSN